MGKSSRSQKNQRALVIVSLLVVASMAVGLVVSFIPEPPRATPTPTWTPVPIPTPTPTPHGT